MKVFFIPGRDHSTMEDHNIHLFKKIQPPKKKKKKKKKMTLKQTEHSIKLFKTTFINNSNLGQAATNMEEDHHYLKTIHLNHITMLLAYL
jgi:hypothetical protein